MCRARCAPDRNQRPRRCAPSCRRTTCWPFLLVHLRVSFTAGVLVELGAEISVASTTVPLRSIRPLAPSSKLTVARIRWPALCFSSTWRNRKMVLSSGSRSSQPPRPAKSRTGACRAAPLPWRVAQREPLLHEVDAQQGLTGNGGRPRLLRGRTARSAPPVGPRHHPVHLVEELPAARALRSTFPNPRLLCFMGSWSQAIKPALLIRPAVLQTFPNSEDLHDTPV